LPSSECVAVEFISERLNVRADDIDPLFVVLDVVANVSCYGTRSGSTFECASCPDATKHRHISAPYVCIYTSSYVVANVSCYGTRPGSTFERASCPDTTKHRHISAPYVCIYTSAYRSLRSQRCYLHLHFLTKLRF